MSGKERLSKYLKVTAEGGTRMWCRLCDAELYSAPPSPMLDVGQMSALLQHLLLKHEVTREELAADCQDAFDKGMKEERARKA